MINVDFLLQKNAAQHFLCHLMEDSSVSMVLTLIPGVNIIAHQVIS